MHAHLILFKISYHFPSCNYAIFFFTMIKTLKKLNVISVDLSVIAVISGVISVDTVILVIQFTLKNTLFNTC